MKKIDRETVQRILDTADIVDVVSDYVSLKRRGANYIGLCPFHNERTPSFSVSKSKGICKCFSCGKGGSPVNFIMEIEQLTYNEALRHLAKKYNIEIVEREMSEDERLLQSKREGMLAVNLFAMEHFERNLLETVDGQEIGLAYFRKRGINDAMIKRFHLGYSLEKGDDLYHAAAAKGFSEDYLLQTGLCSRSDRGTIYDRFKGRVMYPVHGISGKVVAFGGRTLRSDKTMAKYVNSPESEIYSKSRELYGLYQAKQAIAKQNKCILVEGYMDVISMHQAGVENVVASSGTSLTEGQIRLIHRFTENITVIYDSDAAGIKASLRGIDMILAEGINVKVLSLPDGDDPDSFAQTHTAEEVEQYLAANETDFIRFKTRILLADAADDPISRSRVITDILRTIAVIPEAVTRSVYIAECSRAFDIDEQALMLQLNKIMTANIEAAERRQQQEKARESIRNIDSTTDAPAGDTLAAEGFDAGQSADTQDAITVTPPTVKPTERPGSLDSRAQFLEPFERHLLRLILKFGLIDFCEAVCEDGSTTFFNVIDFVHSEFARNEIGFTVPAYNRIFELASEIRYTTWDADKADNEDRVRSDIDTWIKNRREEFILSKPTEQAIKNFEKKIEEESNVRYKTGINNFAIHYIEQRLCSSPDDEVRRISTDLVSERHHLSKIHTKLAKIDEEVDCLKDLAPRTINELCYGVIGYDIRQIERSIASLDNQEDIIKTMKQYAKLKALQKKYAKELGERIVSASYKGKK